MNSARLTQSLTRALADLEAERTRIEEAISRLQGVIREMSAAPRGRQAASAAKVTRNWSAASRRAAAERMRLYWAKRRKGSAAKRTAAKAGKKAPAKRSTKGWTPEARKAAAERMRRYWADRSKKKDTSKS